VICLGIETSCDETSIAFVEDGNQIRANLISSQVEIHQLYGGVVPEIASRKHLENLNVLLDEALREAKLSWKQIEIVAATRGPGLVGALLVGVAAAKSIALGLNVPFIGVNHLVGHVYANFLEHPDLKFPFLALIVSGGHTSLVLLKEHLVFETLGTTRDDAAGEAFDKVARIFDLGYPGGPIIDKLAQKGNPRAIEFPRALLGSDSLDFSFSGLKTAVMNWKKNGDLNHYPIEDLSASFQEAVVDVLVEKVRRAILATGVKTVVLAGGVACNTGLRARLNALADDYHVKLHHPSPRLCTDNAAMIACAGTFQYWKGAKDELDADVTPPMAPLERLTCINSQIFASPHLFSSPKLFIIIEVQEVEGLCKEKEPINLSLVLSSLFSSGFIKA